MIKHIYLYRLQKGVNAEEVREKILTLKEHIPQIDKMEVEFDFKHAGNSYDMIESCSFRSMEDFVEFGQDKYHDSLRKYMASITKESAKIDFESGQEI